MSSDTLDVRTFTVGLVAENCHVVRAGSQEQRAVIIDPGDEAPRLLEALEDLGITTVEAILITHCHFDHIGAVAPLARATGAPVYCPVLEEPALSDLMAYVPFVGVGSFESYQADHTLAGGEQLTFAGLTFDVRFTPGHSPGHLTYALPGEPALFSGDVLFAGSVGRVDLPGGDWDTLLHSIGGLMEEFPAQTVIYPGHMRNTTLAHELDTNSFLNDLRTGASARHAS